MPFIIALLAIKYPEYHLLFFLFVLLASLFNDLFFFWLGSFSMRLIERHIPSLQKAKSSTRARAFFNRYGPLAFIIGRFIPFGGGNTIIIAASAVGTTPARFFPWTGIACTLYALIYFYGSFYFGSTLRTVSPPILLISLLLFVGTVAMVRFIVPHLWSKSRPGEPQ